ncbi:hypothetical protein HBN50_11970 [Halobacteriovorax sp. GB3]|uniref:hypothetical protein n=1 Tax=Halobacteriovorax sp. GB3 TaxID=2719615 RepID=UPI00235FEA2E|nr:hypothetical protein [Halobacteriovorax sp. GB3]MDD0853818.1 hypothetical protein [Halobacteriovorax sp. GB3]
MKTLKTILFISLLISSSQAFYELDGQFSYDKKTYGTERQNKSTSRAYFVSFASYFFSLTALEFNYSTSKDIETNNTETKLTGTDFTRVSEQSNVESEYFGIGLRQAFAGKDSFLIPTLSLGYARQFATYYSSQTYRNDTGGADIFIEGEKVKTREDSIFGTFSLKLKLTKLLSITGSIKTLFPADDFNKAKDYIKYTAGFTWMFQ